MVSSSAPRLTLGGCAISSAARQAGRRSIDGDQHLADHGGSRQPARLGGAGGGAAGSTDPLAKIGHIVVIFEENRSFDNFFGKFPGANGLANAGDKAIQIGPDGKPYKSLPAAMNSNLKPPAVDKRFPAQLPNRPFQINRYVPLDDDTGDLIHASIRSSCRSTAAR